MRKLNIVASVQAAAQRRLGSGVDARLSICNVGRLSLDARFQFMGVHLGGNTNALDVASDTILRASCLFRMPFRNRVVCSATEACLPLVSRSLPLIVKVLMRAGNHI